MGNHQRKKLRVAFLIAERFPEPVGSFLLDQITSFIDMGIDVKVFVLHKKENAEHENIKKYKVLERTTFLNVPRRKLIRFFDSIPILARGLFYDPIKVLKSFNIKRYGKMALTLNFLYWYNELPKLKEEFDIIHCHFGVVGLMGLYLKDIGMKGKLVTSFYGSDIGNYPKKNGEDVYIPLFKTGDIFIANSNSVKERLLQYGCPEDKISKIIPLAIRSDKFKPSKTIKKPKKYFRILTVARLMEEKGHKYSIKAIAELVKKNYYNIKYIIVGDGPERQYLENLVSELGINKYVKFLGRLSDKEMVKQYKMAHIFVLPSVHATEYFSEEGQGVVNQEAQLMELPVISTNVGGIPEGLLDGRSGFIVPEKNSNIIAEKIEVLINNSLLRKKMGLVGRKFVMNKYSTKKMVSDVIKIYDIQYAD
jgi:colanic acid/amylovoran biosynthesis glycosyltransferase